MNVTARNNVLDGALKSSVSFLKVVGIIVSLAAAYFLTIQSLKVELAAKAEGAVVETLDKRLTNFEVMLREGVVSREQFYQFSKDVEARLTRIEFYLKEQMGEKSGKR
ncbi:MAG: hypothetical protein JSW34_09775 [Candidatus Zixiibacteriota bacterium]|nr:MAG: hypothetical protein JSW34_09775 [candidate division Zixibacteria bacterium]